MENRYSYVRENIRKENSGACKEKSPVTSSSMPERTHHWRARRLNKPDEIAGKHAGNILDKLITWIKNKIWGAAEYIKIAATNQYLKLKDKVAELIPEHEVPKRKRTNPSKQRQKRVTDHFNQEEKLSEPFNLKQGRKGNKPVEQGMREGRKANLQDLHAEEVARRATRNPQIRKDVLMNPKLVDAGSEWEAQVKIDLAAGKDITPVLEANPQLDVDTIMDKIGTEWAARAGQNQMGTQQMVDALNQANGADTSPGADADTGIDAGGDTGTDADSGGSTPTSAMHGGPLPGVGSIDVSTGSSSSGNSGVEGVSPSVDAGSGVGGGDVGGGGV